jgi:hypothetical protein
MQTLIEAEEKPLGIIESMQAGFNFLNRHVWLLVPPVLLDIFLWLAPRVTLSPLFRALADFMMASQPTVPEDLESNLDVTLTQFIALGESFNLLALLGQLPTRLPSLLARPNFHTLPSPLSPVVAISDWQVALFLILVLIPVGVLIGGFWLTWLAFSLEGKRLRSGEFFRRWGWVWLNVNLYLLLLILGLTAFVIAYSLFGVFVILLLGAVGATIVMLLWLLFLGLGIWLSIGLYFVVLAIALDGINLARAVWRSLNVVGRNALSTLGFILLTMVLLEGFAIIWFRLSAQPWGVPVGILGNAYLGVAITAAAFLFYQSRYQHWQKTRALLMLGQTEDNA